MISPSLVYRVIKIFDKERHSLKGSMMTEIISNEHRITDFGFKELSFLNISRCDRSSALGFWRSALLIAMTQTLIWEEYWISIQMLSVSNVRWLTLWEGSPVNTLIALEVMPRSHILQSGWKSENTLVSWRWQCQTPTIAQPHIADNLLAIPPQQQFQGRNCELNWGLPVARQTHAAWSHSCKLCNNFWGIEVWATPTPERTL